jgi:hypothetical protein
VTGGAFGVDGHRSAAGSESGGSVEQRGRGVYDVRKPVSELQKRRAGVLGWFRDQPGDLW